jgi:hypothetical protein
VVRRFDTGAEGAALAVQHLAQSRRVLSQRAVQPEVPDLQRHHPEIPEPQSVVRDLARKFAIDLDALNRKTLTFARIEAGLIRLRRKIRPPDGGDNARS